MNDVVVVISLDEKQKYEDEGFINVFTYQFLKEFNNYDWMAGRKVWCDEVFMMEIVVIHKLIAV